MNRYDFDDEEFDRLLQMTNDFVEGTGFLNVFVFMPDILAKALQGEVRYIVLY